MTATEGLLLRLGSLEPMDVPSSLVPLARAGRIAPAFHLPLQHASDAVLARMRRPYTIDGYRRLVNGLRTALPGASIGADVIVGFPGETDRDFELLCEYLGVSPLTQLHVFPYSERPGTEAARLPNRVHGEVIRARGRRIRDIGESLRRGFQRGQIGAERVALTIEDGRVAVTDNGLRLAIGPGHARNERVLVEVVDIGRGRVIEREPGPSVHSVRRAEGPRHS